MNTLLISPASKTPEVNFDANSGQLLIKGRSIPENSIEFYKPVYEWIDAYAAKTAVNTTLVVQLDYFNTSSSKCLLDILRKMEGLKKSGATVTIDWCYESDDEDMKEAGEDYESIVTVPFTYKSI
jgi:hypothetical protein